MNCHLLLTIADRNRLLCCIIYAPWDFCGMEAFVLKSSKCKGLDFEWRLAVLMDKAVSAGDLTYIWCL